MAPKPTAETTPAREKRAGRLWAIGWEAMRAAGRGTGRAVMFVWRRPRLRVGVIFAIVLIPLPIYCIWLIATRPEPLKITMTNALQALDDGNEWLAAQQAQKLYEAEVYAPWNHGGPAYILGMLAVRRAAASAGETQREEHALAVSYLRESRQQGIPAGREAQTLVTLAKTLQSLGQFEESIEPLRAALVIASSPPTDDHVVPSENALSPTHVHWLLATAYHHLAGTSLPLALEHVGQFLQDSHLSAAERTAGLLERAEIYFELDQALACREAIAQVPADSPQQLAAQLLEARLLLREAQQLRGQVAAPPQDVHATRPAIPPAAKDKYLKTLSLLEKARGRESLDHEPPLEAIYLSGVCREEMGDAKEALAAYGEVLRRGDGEGVVLAAELRQAEMLQRRGDAAEAMLTLQEALRAVRSPGIDAAPWLTREDFRTRVAAFHASLMSAGEYLLALRLAKQADGLLSPAEQTRLLAETHTAFAERLTDHADQAVHESPRDHHHQAAEAYERLAELEYTTARYPEHLAAAARSYQGAADYARAERLFRAYLTHDVAKQERPTALLNMARAQMAQANPRGAAATLRELRDQFGHDPVVYSARLLASEAYVQLGQFDEAQQALRENFDGGELTPDSNEWRDSLFAQGQLHSLRENWPQVIKVFDEALARYPQAPQALRARYALAMAHLQIAAALARPSATADPEMIRQAKVQRQQHLTAALAMLEALLDAAPQRPEEALDELDRQTLRGARFAQARTLFQLQRDEDGVRACAAIVNRYQTFPDVLEVYVQMATGLRQLDRGDEARAALAQARMVLDQLPEATSFAHTTHRTKAAWRKFLLWMAKE